MLKEQTIQNSVLGLVAILGILMVALTAKAGLTTSNPIPADGAVDVETASLEWAPGDTSVSFMIYLSTDATIEESELVAETDLTIHLTALDDGAAYHWRVDAVEADGTVIEGAVWSFTTLPFEAHFPNPQDGAEGILSGSTLSWTAGKGVIMHDVYFGTDEALVAAGDWSTFKGKLMVASFYPGALEAGVTYYWKIDEFSITAGGIMTIPGPVWNFTVALEVTIDIKPGSNPNPINPGSNGLVPVAILSSPEFDATQVYPTSVELAGASVAVRGKGKSMAHKEDVNEDGLIDLVVQVETQSFSDLGEGGMVELTGTTFGGQAIVGYDDVIIVPPE